MIWKAALFSAVAGFGHLLLGRYLRGVGLFFLFAVSVNGVVLSLLWHGEETARMLRLVGGSAAVIVWCAAMADVLRLTVRAGRPEARERRAGMIRDALRAYLLDHHVEAERALEQALELSPDRRDADVLFLLGAIARRQGQAGKARRLLRRCRRADAAGKWRHEVEAELAGGGGQASDGPAAERAADDRAPSAREAVGRRTG